MINKSSGDTPAAAATGVDVFQQRKPRLLGTPPDEGEIEDDQVVSVVHAHK